MASKRKKNELNTRREGQRPRGGIPADLSKQAPSCGTYRNYYFDIEFNCVDCGKEEVWKAKDQKWYFEVVKGPIEGQPKRCRECRKKFRAMKAEQHAQMEAAQRARQERKQNSES